MIFGVDVSAYQAAARMREAKEAGASFVIVKVTEGNGYANPHAREQVEAAVAEGLFVMLYHFARPNGPDWLRDARAEAARVAAIASELDAVAGYRLFCWLDVERNEPLTLGERSLWRFWAHTFREAMRAAARGLGWYSYGPFTEQLELEADWSRTLLWLARYPQSFKVDCSYPTWPTAIRPWARADVWQFGGDANGATWPGIDGPADVNAFAGSLEELQELLSAAA